MQHLPAKTRKKMTCKWSCFIVEPFIRIFPTTEAKNVVIPSPGNQNGKEVDT